MPQVDRRRTRFTSVNGILREKYNEAWNHVYLDAAQAAGIPSHWLERNGADIEAGSPAWERKGDLTGAWSDLLMQLDDCLRGVDYRGKPYRRNMSRVMNALAWLVKLAKLAGVDPDSEGLIPWDAYGFRLQMYTVHGWPLPEDFSDVVLEAAGADRAQAVEDFDAMAADWGCPSGPGHDDHGHGRSPHGWTCLDGSARKPVTVPEPPVSSPEAPAPSYAEAPVVRAQGLQTWVLGTASWQLPANVWEQHWVDADDDTRWVNDPERAEAEGAVKPAWMN